MLTATYTLVALSVEQTSVRVSLQSLQNYVQNNLRSQAALTPAQVEYACGTLKRLYENCHWRKLDKFVIPAIRRATRACDDLLAELESLSEAAADAMAAALRAIEAGALEPQARLRAFCAAIERFCGALLQRLEREEQELFKAAGSLVPGEAWFAVANQMLAHESYRKESRGGGPIRSGRSWHARAERTQRQGVPASFAH
jgi:hypothetical protein